MCGKRDRSRLVARGEDFEYRTSPDTFQMYLCERCDAYFLHPRPERSELGRIYPPNYHAYEFSEDEYGIAYEFRRRLEKRRLLDWCHDVPSGGSIVDIGAGDGFHLRILRDFGDPTWRLEAVEPDERAAEAISDPRIQVHRGFLDEVGLPPDSYDFAMMIMVIEHVDDPAGILRSVHRILRPGGRVGIVTDNIRSVDARLGRRRHWGGYHFPRHFNLFSPRSLRSLAAEAGLEVVELKSMMSPVNWTYTVHNYLADRSAPEWLVRSFTLKSALALGGFTLVDALCTFAGRGALMRAVLRKPD
ncbi:MAG: class I SAM-dependent methyltransferase [Acidimicrobiales bacterium]|nr:class I SAM-dependent methyltransferase [Acidimicrobiales bacterium]